MALGILAQALCFTKILTTTTGVFDALLFLKVAQGPIQIAGPVGFTCI